jgi:hypothetical protein
VPWTHALGLLVVAWHHAYQARAAVVLGEDIDLAADHDGLAGGMVQAGLAAVVGKGKVRVAGVEERVAWLELQSNKAKSAANARWQRASGEHASGNASGIPSAMPSHTKPDAVVMPYSLISSDLSDLDKVADGVADDTPRSERKTTRIKPVPSAEGVELAEYLLAAILSHHPDATNLPKNLDGWARELDVGLRGGVTAARFRAAIDFAHRDPRGTFWRANIRSAAKLREQLDVLEIQDREKPKGGAPRQQTLAEAGLISGEDYIASLRSGQ